MQALKRIFAPTCQPGVKINEEGDRIFVGGIRDTCQHLFSIRLQREDLEVIKEYDICHTSCYSNLNMSLKPCRIATCGRFVETQMNMMTII